MAGNERRELQPRRTRQRDPQAERPDARPGDVSRYFAPSLDGENPLEYELRRLANGGRIRGHAL